jgi:peptidoglycan/LPS O-acetylase OafA/YrhL
MGILRLLFALSVVFTHLDLEFLVGGRIAVELFFMTSGYLIAGIISSKKYSSRKNFILSRLVRIYPIYFITLIATILFNFTIGSRELSSIYKFLLENENYFLIFLSILVNFMILGQDLLFFIKFSPNLFSFTTNYLDYPPYLNRVLVVPQGWTLSLELYFYLIYSLLYRYKKVLLLIFILSTLLRLYFTELSLATQEPWDYRFFPLEVNYFLLGVGVSLMSSKLNYLLNGKVMRLLQQFLYLLFIALILFGSLLSLKPVIATILYVCLYLVVLPISAKMNRASKVDSYLGQLSYPIYVVHILVIQIFTYYVGDLHENKNEIVQVLMVILFSGVLILKFIVDPIEKYRKRFGRLTN